MTVIAVNDSKKDRKSERIRAVEKPNKIPSPDIAGKIIGMKEEKKKRKCERRLDEDQEKLSDKRNIGGYVHSQILKIREEDSHIGEDFGEGLSAKDNKIISGGHNHHHDLASEIDAAVILSRPILPCSPLGGKTPIKTFH